MPKPEGLRGDADTSAPVVPQTTVPTDVLKEEENLARFSKTKEFQRLKEFLEARIEFYKKRLPSGDLLKETNIKEEDLPMYWKIACTVIGEFENVLKAYEDAQEVVENAKRNT